MLTKEQRNSLESLTSLYEGNLWQAASYLEGRGLGEEAAVTARLGVAIEPEGVSNNEGMFLSIPYLTRAGVVDIRYRCLREHDHDAEGCGKYRTRAGQPGRLYGVEYLVSAGPWICVTEGELDAVTLHQLGYPAVAVPGATTWKDHWRLLFEDFSRIIVFLDGDHAGASFGKLWAGKFPNSVETVSLDWEEDVNSMFLREGREYFDHIIER